MAKRQSPAHRLWWLLGLLSLVLIIALPLSGLSMELSDGFVKASSPPSVIGYSRETFNTKNENKALERSLSRWRAASPVDLPGAGIAYTPRGLDRNDYDYLTALPNSLSTEQNVPDLFLIPQAKTPISGRPWGIRLSYNCSVVQSKAELTILPKKNSLPLQIVSLQSAHKEGVFGSGPTSSDVIYAYNSSAENLFLYAELGAIINTTYISESVDPNPDILEYVMWQARGYVPIQGPVSHDFNNTIAMPIPDIDSPLVMDANGTVTPNEMFFERGSGSENLRQFVAGTDNLTLTNFIETAQPIGVRCQALSETGFATLHPDELAFSDFIRVPPERPPPPYSGVSGVGWYYIPYPFGFSPWAHLSKPETVFANILESIETPLSIRIGPSQVYPNYVQAADLQQSLMGAYAQSALNLMYYGFETFNQGYVAENLTSSQPGKILGPGALPPHVPMVMLAIWAMGCVILGLVYGFRRRQAETLDGYLFSKLSAHYAKSIGDLPAAIGPRSIL
ncbi:hypothetical protein N7519_005800 [Penicillium mononematosum]|uniref:uncharacterized protein n=1 Tax=Penicillium mononematosum TaxID=268346 RepID=UPI0025473E5C|nr:uncharacterized protein N7519_005800 [Penicillium mononematosum]KAJ6184499.1 hypothetical protein N7519_005800 [Penicillium mononematosum]